MEGQAELSGDSLKTSVHSCSDLGFLQITQVLVLWGPKNDKGWLALSHQMLSLGWSRLWGT